MKLLFDITALICLSLGSNIPLELLMVPVKQQQDTALWHSISILPVPTTSVAVFVFLSHGG